VLRLVEQALGVVGAPVVSRLRPSVQRREDVGLRDGRIDDGRGDRNRTPLRAAGRARRCQSRYALQPLGRALDRVGIAQLDGVEVRLHGCVDE